MDKREHEAWRRWVTDPTPENAQRWAALRSRSMDRKPGTVLVKDYSFPTKKCESVFKQAAQFWLDTPWEEVFVEDFEWITECHFWLLDGVSPRVLKNIQKVFEDHELVLKEGDEMEAKEDHAAHTTNSSHTAGYKRQIDRLKTEKKQLEERVNRLTLKNSRLETDRRNPGRDEQELHRLRGVEDSYEILKRENDRLTRLLQEANRG